MKRVRDIDWNNPRFVRAGIIPYVEIRGIRFYAFGIEEAVAAIVDFGGHKEKKDIDLLDAAIREYEEEALNIFGPLNRDMLQNFYAIEGLDTVEILLPVNGNMYTYTDEFDKLVYGNLKHEVQSIIWLSRQQLLLAIDSQHITYKGNKIFHMYSRIVHTNNINREFI